MDKDDAPARAQCVLDSIEQKFGQPLNLFRTLAHQPDVLVGVAKINDGIHEDLPADLRELAYYKASHVNECKYCTHWHRKAALRSGVSEDQLRTIDDYVSDGVFNDRQKTVLAYAEQLTRTAHVDPTIVRKLKRFLNDRQLVTLAATVALANFTNRVNHGLGVELP
jgi:uncharacterized peroxidase-related enzyme